ncbi:helix-turn-helix domain-containing protein [Nocardia yamanashiensis]|uniref:helix-turn-helix domain-containing protein n=1 Tax=Nocardia yamanashiensis TaxID=209247 RepID=UPI001E512A1C|nr:helix-turn-helix transcriptional regulator [Nocardia yamanashiensis]UGT40180.1 helix-turn-helix domain-containing protein [Nocardia yamanashiensis]
MVDSVQEASEALGKRLREIRRDAGVTGRELAARAHWHESKVSRIEHGKVRPSTADLRAYCTHCDANEQLADLLASLHNIDSAWLEWRRLLGTGVRRGQQLALKLEAETAIIRNYEPQIIPGLLQTAEYAEAKLKRVIEFYRLPDDLDAGVSKRMERQQILYKRGHQFHFLIAEASLYTTVGDDQVMRGQLDRLQTIIGMPRVTLGIIPLMAEALVVVEGFMMFDNRMVKVEAHTAELTVTQPREVALYGRAFDTLAGQSATGEAARALIRTALHQRTQTCATSDKFHHET